jgi:hypothetical protein
MPHSIGQAPSFAKRKDLQRSANDLSASAQLDMLADEPAKPSAPVDVMYLLGLGSLRRAIRYSLSLRDLEPKQVYPKLGKDAAAWSRIENGGISFPADDIPKLLKITGNDAVLRWLAHECGYDIVPLKSELEQQLEAERAARLEAERENALMRELLQGRK